MTRTQWNNIAVVGAGTIGLSWAALFAAHGRTVRLTDPREDLADTIRDSVPMLATGLGVNPQDLLDRITAADSLADAVQNADLVQENGPERLEFKQELFADIAANAPEHAVFASSSSGIISSEIGAELPDEVAARLLIAHPFNPPHVVPLVEIVPNPRTSEQTVEAVTEFYTALGKTPVRVRKEVSGFVANRLQSALMQEAFSLVLDGVVPVEDLDTVVKSSLGGRWATIGPFESFHLGGGPDGIRHMIEHLGKGMAERWKDLGHPALTDANAKILADQTEDAYGSGPENYRERAANRDRKQNAVNEAVSD